MRKENLKELSPAALRRKARQLDEESLELCRRAQELRRHANEILRKRRLARASAKQK